MRLGLTLGSLALLSLACSSASAATNLLANPGFEAPVTTDGPPFVGSWEAFNGSAGSGSGNAAVAPHSGQQHLNMNITNSDNDFAGAFQEVSGLVAGQTVTWEGFHMSPTTSGLDIVTEIRIEWRAGVNGAGATPNQNPIPTGAYAPFSMTTTVPAGVDGARVVYAIQSFTNPGVLNTGTVYLDDVSFSIAPEPTSIAALGAASVLLRRRRR
jgi:hypothetical protein